MVGISEGEKEHSSTPATVLQIFCHLRQGLAIHRAGDLPDQVTGGNTHRIALPGGIDFRHDHHIRLFQLLNKFRKQRLGTGVGVGLEGNHKPMIAHRTDSLNGGSQFIRVMGIVIVDHSAVVFTLIFHTAASAMEGSQARAYCLAGNAQHPGCAGHSQRVEGVMLAQHAEIHMAIERTVADHIKMPPIGAHVGRSYPVFRL